MTSLLQLDKSIFLFFNNLHTDWADVFFFWFTNPYLWVVVGVIIGLFWLLKQKKKAIIPILIMVVGLALTDQSCNLLKNSIKRLRPSQDPTLTTEVQLVENPDGTLYKGGKYGFPSGHAATSIFLALYLSLAITRRHWWVWAALFAWVALFSYSRLYLGVHYPLDILCGYLLGSLWAILAFLLRKRLNRQR